MEKNGNERISMSVPPGVKQYLEAVASHNDMSGGMTEALLRIVGFARKLGELGVGSEMTIIRPETNEPVVYILPLTFIDPSSVVTDPTDNS